MTSTCPHSSSFQVRVLGRRLAPASLVSLDWEKELGHRLASSPDIFDAEEASELLFSSETCLPRSRLIGDWEALEVPWNVPAPQVRPSSVDLVIVLACRADGLAEGSPAAWYPSLYVASEETASPRGTAVDTLDVSPRRVPSGDLCLRARLDPLAA